MYAVSMARNLDVQVENKQVVQFKIPEWCSFSVRDIHIAYIRLHSSCIHNSSKVRIFGYCLIYMPLRY